MSLAFVTFYPWPVRVSERQQALARERSRARAEAVASVWGVSAERDPAIDTTFTLRDIGARGAMLTMGSPIFRVGLFRHEPRDWMVLRAKGSGLIPPGALLRPPQRTVFEWRDGAPGEAPTLVTPRGVPLVVEGGGLDEKGCARWIDSFPSGVSLVMFSEVRIELRAKAPVTNDPLLAVKNLLALLDSA